MTTPPTTPRETLRDLIKELAVVHGRITLSSGREADYYVDLRRVTLHHEAAPLIGHQLLDLLEINGFGPAEVDAVGGLTLGADPVAGALLHAAASRGLALDAFVVRKEAKAHGMQRRIEGPDVVGKSVVAVEDTSTTGGSVLTAVEALREAGANVVAVAVIVDRDTGSREVIEAAGPAVPVPLRPRGPGPGVANAAIQPPKRCRVDRWRRDAGRDLWAQGRRLQPLHFCLHCRGGGSGAGVLDLSDRGAESSRPTLAGVCACARLVVPRGRRRRNRRSRGVSRLARATTARLRTSSRATTAAALRVLYVHASLRRSRASGRSPQIFTVTQVSLDVPFPRLDLIPEDIGSRLLNAVGFADIDLESAEFNRTWRVQCADKRYATDFLDPRMMQTPPHQPIARRGGSRRRQPRFGVERWDRERQGSLAPPRPRVRRRGTHPCARGAPLREADAGRRAIEDERERNAPTWAKTGGILNSGHYTGIGVDADGDGVDDYTERSR